MNLHIHSVPPSNTQSLIPRNSTQTIIQGKIIGLLYNFLILCAFVCQTVASRHQDCNLANYMGNYFHFCLIHSISLRNFPFRSDSQHTSFIYCYLILTTGFESVIKRRRYEIGSVHTENNSCYTYRQIRHKYRIQGYVCT